jgi:hypothetical protein
MPVIGGPELARIPPLAVLLVGSHPYEEETAARSGRLPIERMVHLPTKATQLDAFSPATAQTTKRRPDRPLGRRAHPTPADAPQAFSLRREGAVRCLAAAGREQLEPGT